MACSKTPVTREEVGVEVLRGNRGRGGRRPPTASYWKEKEKENVDGKGKAKIDGNRARNLQLHDEGSNIDTQRRKDLVVSLFPFFFHFLVSKQFLPLSFPTLCDIPLYGPDLLYASFTLPLRLIHPASECFVTNTNLFSRPII
ncbi:hypothetical protein Syun_019517 [Stephania yunnanensis]|uniref:Uncharacterized protein n=1 Tax=Stephania yunnanensis TaxID=152371 RepID=A0AAP0NY23_9MAGN